LPPRAITACSVNRPDPTGSYANVRSTLPPPFPVIRARLDRAPATSDLAGVRSAARELPNVVKLADAVQVLLIMLDVEDPAFDGAAVRWVARFAAESRGATLSELLAAVEALDALPDADAQRTVMGLLRRHGHG
jgi:hypothetical protein